MAYTQLVRLNLWLSWVRRKLGRSGYWSLAGYAKRKVKTALNFIFDFEDSAVRHARERGLDGGTIAKQMGVLQILFGTLGAVLGGVASDRFARHFKGGHASVLALMVLVMAPLMLAYRFAPAGSALFYIGMCAGFVLPLATYGPANALIQALTQIQEMTLVFVPKIIAIFAALLIFLPLMGALLAGFAEQIFTRIADF